ncbi:MAG: L,D-transpeptidase, partial [bacterium]
TANLMEWTKMKRLVKSRFFAVWLIFFIVLSARAGWRCFSIAATVSRLETAAGELHMKGREAMRVAGDLKDLDDETGFFNELMAMYPENRGYLRSQKAIAEEVKELRKQASARLGGRRHIAVDTRANKLYIRKGLRLLWEADCSVGKGGMVRERKTGRRWSFSTPRGEFSVITKIDSPRWIKPDWAYAENSELPPPPGDPSRVVEDELGKYALDIGHGYLIHGIRNESALGQPVSHGCIRLGAENLEKLYKTVPVGTKVFIY